MKKARELVEYFTKSNQKLDILKDRQRTIPMCSNLKRPLTILQDGKNGGRSVADLDSEANERALLWSLRAVGILC